MGNKSILGSPYRFRLLPLRNRDGFWYAGQDLRNVAVYEALRREKFEQIMNYYLKNTNDLDATDKYSKLRPLINYLQKKFLEKFIPCQKIYHDKS